MFSNNKSIFKVRVKYFIYRNHLKITLKNKINQKTRKHLNNLRLLNKINR
jgi:hypothetical protein